MNFIIDSGSGKILNEIHHKNIAYESGVTKVGLYSLLDKLIKTGSKIAINISEKI